MGQPKPKVTVTMRALVQRINRRLAAEGEVLRGTRGRRWHNTTGDYYVVNVRHNALLAGHVDPVQLGRKLKVLQPWESVK